MPFNLWDWLAGAADTIAEAGEDAWDWLSEAGEDVWDFLNNAQLIIARDSAKDYAAAYHLDGDGEAFEELWGLMINATLFAHEHHDAARSEVVRELAVLADVVQAAPIAPTPFGRPVSATDDDGFLTVQVAPTEGKYAIFSDHHMLFSGCRQNFFRDGGGGGGGNRDLYVEVLRDFYAVEEYTLVENGDVEELIILEPDLGEIDNIKSWSWDEVKSYRESKKIPQLEAIVRDNRDYYIALQDGFIGAERYFRITGNHDRDMRLQAFADTVSDTAGIDMPLASDALLLRTGGRVAFIVCHGHQFDTSCTPAFAAELGESFSQASAWAFQGPDRVWRTAFDPVDEWLSGERSFANALVTDEADVTDNWDIPLVGLTPREVVALLNTNLPDWVAEGLGHLETQAQWENIYDKNIAWEYFDNAARPGDAIDEEVKTGKRWFKFRHLNEILIVDEMRKNFPGDVPTLVLGHSHEPRLRSGHPTEQQAIDCYLNSASAGRFENLIWGLELIDGAPSLISWHRGDAAVGHQPVRTVWRDGRDDDAFVLVADSAAPLDELLTATGEDDTTTLYVAIAHLD